MLFCYLVCFSNYPHSFCFHSQPAIYVAESAISSGTAGSSSSGAENTAAIAGGLALIALAAASSILLQVNKNPPQVQTVEYNGPSLTYYINKFKPPEVLQTALPTTETESAPPILTDSSAPDTPPAEVQSQLQPDSSTFTENTESSASPAEVQSQLQQDSSTSTENTEASASPVEVQSQLQPQSATSAENSLS
ncbi:Protein MAINTENANCE OF PSII UNDER HIGH LIGHT 1 [Linum perenne]